MFLGMSEIAFAALVVLLGFARLAELRRSARNEQLLRRQGAYEVGAAHYPAMVAMHSAFLLACLAEVLLLPTFFRWTLAAPMLSLWAMATALRYWAIRSLGGRWTTRIWVLPSAGLKARGPYRWFRHPNYLAVIVEFACFPLIHGAWRSALFFSIANALVLRTRIRQEEAALSLQAPASWNAQARFWPQRKT